VRQEFIEKLEKEKEKEQRKAKFGISKIGDKKE
jgi:hypothetical protein